MRDGMKCWKCGNEITDGKRFCGACGAEQTQGASGQDGGAKLLGLFAIVCAVVYGLGAVGGMFNLMRSVWDMVLYWYRPSIYSLFMNLAAFARVLLGVWMCFVLSALALRRTRETVGGMFLGLFCGGGALILLRALTCLAASAFYRADSYSGVLQTAAGVLISVGGCYAILRFVVGEDPFAGKTPEELGQMLRNMLLTLGQMGGQGARAAQSAWNSAQQSGMNAQYGNGNAPYLLKTDRSLVMYIVLTIVTCGIYSWYVIYTLARDMNIACAEDGRNTPGLLKFTLLNIVTCGIYNWIWYFSLGNRMAINAPRYGLMIKEDGVTLLLWIIFGSLLCGIGPFVALYILLRNANLLCDAYNRSQF